MVFWKKTWAKIGEILFPGGYLNAESIKKTGQESNYNWDYRMYHRGNCYDNVKYKSILDEKKSGIEKTDGAIVDRNGS